MNTLIEFLNRAAAGLPAVAGPFFLQSSLLIGVLLVFDRFTRRRLRPAVRHALWLLVPIKLLLPPSLALPTGLGYWLARPAGEPGLGTEPPARLFASRYLVRYFDSPPAPEVGSVTTSAAPPSPRTPLALTRNAGLALTWLLGSGWLLSWMMLRTATLRRIARESLPAPEEMVSEVEVLRRQLSLSRPVDLRLVDDGQSPALCGLWRPVVLLPRRLAHRLTPGQRRAVLLHELAHSCRGDLWINAVQTLLQIVWWWHPLVWLANARIRATREEAVDDTVAFELGDDSESYPLALLEVARGVLSRPALSLGLLGILESRSALRARIERLFEHPPRKRPRLHPAALLAIAVLGLVLLPMARGTAPSASSAPVWLPWSPESVAAARQAGHPVLVHFTADWALNGRAGNEQALGAPAVREQLRQLGVVTFRADGTRQSPGVDEVLRQHRRGGLPLTLVYPANPEGAALALPELLRSDLVLAALDQAAASRPAPPVDPIPEAIRAPSTNTADLAGARVVAGLRQRLTAAEAELAELLARHRDQWPAVISKRTEVELLRHELATRGDATAIRDLRWALNDAQIYRDALLLSHAPDSPEVTQQRQRVEDLERVLLAAGPREFASSSSEDVSAVPDATRSAAAIPAPGIQPRKLPSDLWTIDPWVNELTTFEYVARTNATEEPVQRIFRFQGPALVAALERRTGRHLGDNSMDWGREFRAALESAGCPTRPPNGIYLKFHMGLASIKARPAELAAAERLLVDLGTQPAVFLVEAHGFLLPAPTGKNAGLDAEAGLPPRGEGAGTNTIPANRLGPILAALRKRADVRALGRPRIQLFDGAVAEITDTQPAAIGGGSLKLRVRTDFLRDSGRIRLTCESAVTELLDAAELERNLADTRATNASNPSSDGGAISVRATGYLIHHLTNTVELADGEACVLADRGVAPGPNSGRRAVVYVRASRAGAVSAAIPPSVPPTRVERRTKESPARP